MMLRKSYRAPSLSEAILKIKREMGPKASILETKTHPARKTLFKTVPAEVEVIAGIDEGELTRQQIEKIRGRSLAPEKPALSLASQIMARRETPPPVPQQNTRADEALLREFRQLREKVLQLQEENASLKTRIEELSGVQREIELIERAVAPANLSHMGTASTGNEIREFMNRLAAKGMGWILLDEWKKQLSEKLSVSGMDEMFDASVDFFLNRFTFGKKTMPRLAAFIGGEGAGKTTSILKIAAHLKSSGKSVAIIALDGTDGAAVLGYREWEEKYGIPYFPVRQTRAFKKIMDELAGVDHILVDTYSVEYGDHASVKRLRKRLEEMGAANILVFSGRQDDERKVLDMFRSFPVEALVFTGLDATSRVGCFYNVMKESGLIPLYYGIGERLPQDLEEATTERLVAMLFDIASDAGSDAMREAVS